LINRRYLGEITFREITTENAHEAIIKDSGTFDLAQKILTARGEEHSRRASNSRGYLLTGRIRCPECGKSMIGTAAHGRSKTYRYYTCFSRARYGPKTCDAQRFNAEELDAAVLGVLRDFYTKHTDLIAQAVETARAQHADAHGDRASEQDTINREIAKANAAIDRYFTAFENGTMDEELCAPRLANLKTKLDQLTARRDEPAEEIDDEPVMPHGSGKVIVGECVAWLVAVSCWCRGTVG
jgi:site-specific DNA recombinase